MSRADISAGKAHVELYVKNSRFVKGLNSASKQLSSFGKDLAKIGGVFAAAGAAMLGPLASTISVASDMEEQMNKFNVVFGDSAKAMKEWGDTTGDALGRGSLQMVTFLAATQDLLVPMGFAADQARDMSKEMAKLAIDVASFNNVADADVLRDFHAALTGSGEVMKKYGVIVTEAAVKQRLLNDGMDPKVATDVQKAMARWNIILDGTTAAQGDATRSAGSFANQMKALQAAVGGVRVAIGEQLLPIVTPFVTQAKEAVKVIGAWIKENSHYVRSIAFVASGLTALGAAIGTAGLAFVAIGKAIGAVAFTLSTLTNPIALVMFAIGALGVYWFNFTEQGQKDLATLVKAFKNAWEFIKPIITGISQALSEGDFGLAAEIAANAMEVAFLRAFKAIRENFLEFAAETVGIMEDIAAAMSGNPLKIGAAIGRMVARQQAGGALSGNLEEAESRLAENLARAAAPGQRRAAEGRRSAEIEAIRDETSRMTDIDAKIAAENAALRAEEKTMLDRIAAATKQELNDTLAAAQATRMKRVIAEAEIGEKKALVAILQRERNAEAAIMKRMKSKDSRKRLAAQREMQAFGPASAQRIGFAAQEQQIKRQDAIRSALMAEQAKAARIQQLMNASGLKPKQAAANARALSQSVQAGMRNDPEVVGLLTRQNNYLMNMLNELRMGRAVYQ